MDCAFLSCIILLSVSPYVLDIGFYSDDWAFLGKMSNVRDATVGSLFSLSMIHSSTCALSQSFTTRSCTKPLAWNHSVIM